MTGHFISGVVVLLFGYFRTLVSCAKKFRSDECRHTNTDICAIHSDQGHNINGLGASIFAGFV
jgi:hypothetical protein